MRDTLHLDLGVFGDFQPTLPPSYRDSQLRLPRQHRPGAAGRRCSSSCARPGVVGCDTMNHWIAESRPALEQLLGRVGMLVINDEEARLLSGERNIVKSAARILDMGPRTLLIKRGEYGIIQFAGQSVFAVPAFPLEEVTDPTGAGDCFAGGFMGELARSGDTSPAGLRRAIVYGSVMGSFVVEDFGPRRLLQAHARGHRAPLPAVREPDGDRVRGRLFAVGLFGVRGLFIQMSRNTHRPTANS